MRVFRRRTFQAILLASAVLLINTDGMRIASPLRNHRKGRYSSSPTSTSTSLSFSSRVAIVVNDGGSGTGRLFAESSPTGPASAAAATDDDDSLLLTDHLRATALLEPHNELQNRFAVDDGYVGLGGGTSASRYWSSLPPSDVRSATMAVVALANRAAHERETEGIGRVQLGICAGDTREALTTLKQWVTGLQLPRGLLHGGDVDGVPVELQGAIYIKYSTGGARTFADVRASGRGFDSLWKPGDAVMETYDGDFRGVYFNAELDDGIFRQYGVLPLNMFENPLKC